MDTTAFPLLSSRMKNLETPATIAMSMRARALISQGKKVISLALGEPDFKTPSFVIDAAYQAAKDGNTKYPPIDGIHSLKKAIQRKFEYENAIRYELDEIMVANGVKQILFNALTATLDAEDEVVLPAPYWTSYPIMVKFLGGNPVYVMCEEQNNFAMLAKDLRAKISNKTKWVVLNSPNNPTGAVWSKQTLLAIAEVLREFPHIWIFCDEIYEHFVFDNQCHYSLAALAPDLKSRILTANGASKTYAMPGWRVGYAGACPSLIKAMMKIQSNSTSGACSVSQAALEAALTKGDEAVLEMKQAYNRRRQKVQAVLSVLPGFTCVAPQGAFYLYPGIKGCIGKTSKGGCLIGTDDQFAQALLEEMYVAVVPGSAFGFSPYLRLSYAADEHILEEACDRIARFVLQLS
ncbi:Aspartate/prephenate aminotransferase [Commensalibacter sp. Nvir]|nr:Aspartate/prephenate aminotransferase [Commensalibacter sp. Nvir]